MPAAAAPGLPRMRSTAPVHLLSVLMLAMIVVLRLPGYTVGHGAVTVPRPRNSVDSDLAPWNQTLNASLKIPFDPWCPFPSADAPGRDARNLSGANGQACF